MAFSVYTVNTGLDLYGSYSDPRLTPHSFFRTDGVKYRSEKNEDGTLSIQTGNTEATVDEITDRLSITSTTDYDVTPITQWVPRPIKLEFPEPQEEEEEEEEEEDLSTKDKMASETEASDEPSLLRQYLEEEQDSTSGEDSTSSSNSIDSPVYSSRGDTETSTSTGSLVDTSA